jgi:hypothetical protein
VATRLGVIALISASVLLPLPAHADERDVDGGTVTVRVQIDPLDCVTGCDGGSLPTTGMPSPEPLVWMALALLAVGAVFALSARAARRGRVTPAGADANAYSGVSGARSTLAGGSSTFPPSPGAESQRRQSERGDGACPR